MLLKEFKQMQRRALALFSGGLDSILAVKVIQQQGVDVLAINFTSPFFGCSPVLDGEPVAARYARRYDIPFRSIQLGTDFLEMLRHPRYGYGSALNPCIDCKTFMLRCAGELLAELKADFVITGEVVGQRPMSQRHDTLRLIERDCGLGGLLLRPLSAKFLKITIPESEGWVKREELPALRGRGRKDQMRLAAELGVDEYPVPGGGCLLTEQSYIPKVQDLLDHQTVPLVRDFELLRTGRHFRLSERCKAVVGRDNSDNEKILAIAGSGETTLRWLDGASPLVLMVGEADETAIRQAGRILLRYTKSPKGETGCISVQRDGKRSEISVVHDLDENELERLRI
jgi:tRNA U34 2-thiouridine synthase MnmA/TrmU